MIAKRPLVIMAVSWLTGNIIAWDKGIIWLIGSSLLLICVTVITHSAAKWIRSTPILTIQLAICICCLVGGYVQHVIIDKHNVSKVAVASGSEQGVQGVIVSAVERDGDRAQFTLRLLPTMPSERVRVVVKLNEPAHIQIIERWRRGDIVQTRGVFERPMPATNFDGFDYADYLRNQRIHWLFRVDAATQVDVTHTTEHAYAKLLANMDHIRAHLTGKLEHLFPPNQAGYMSGLLIGIQNDVDPQLLQSYSQLGLTHVLAVSGMHVALFLLALHLLLLKMPLSRNAKLTVMFLLLPLYILFSGAAPSIVRAGLMGMIGLVSARFNLLKDGLHLLATAALLIVIVDPLILHNIGFQLSCTVTAGILLWTEPIRKVLPVQPTKLRKLMVDSFVVTIVAQLASFPISLYYFNTFNGLSLLANFVLVPFISFVVMPLGALALIASYLHYGVASTIAEWTAMLNESTFWIVEQLAAIRSFQFRFPATSFFIPLLSYALIHLCIRAELKKGWRITCALVFVSISLAHYYHLPLYPSSVEYVDVGQGDCALITTPSYKHILIDGGGAVTFGVQEAWRQRRDPFEVGRNIVVPLLQKRGVHQLDLVIVSHLDSDHIRGLIAIAQIIPIRQLVWNGTYRESDDVNALFQTLLQYDVQLHPVTDIDTALQLDRNTTLRLWTSSPLETLREEQEQNPHSVAALVSIYGRTFLFPGDLFAAQERELMQAWNSYLPPEGIDVLKVSHHGSRTSTADDWLKRLSPQLAIISAGRNNMYRHPHPTIVARLQARRIATYTTKEDGGLQIRIDKSGAMYVRSKLTPF